MNTSVPSPTPIIGISGANADSASVRAMMTQIAATGATPMFLGNHNNRNADVDIRKVDAVIVMGNNRDIDPSEYGQGQGAQNSHTKSELVKEDGTPDHEGIARRSYEFRLLELAMNSGMPVLGVCGGMQRINVMCGGKLHQHVPDLVGHNEHAQQDFNIAPFVPVQRVTIAGDTTLASISSGTNAVYTPGHAVPQSLMENSMHHQAVSVVGKGLRAAAFGDDKVKLTDGSDSLLIEAVEADPNGKFGKQFLLGVQWHPEFSASPLGAKIAHAVSGAAQHYAVTHNRQHPPYEAEHETIASAIPEVTPPTVRPGSMTAMILQQRAAASHLSR